MNGVPGGTGGGNATSTPPLPPNSGASGTAVTFSTFGDIFGSYTGDVKMKMESDRHCLTEANRVFDRIETIAPTKLATLKAGNTSYADLLSTPRGQNVEATVGKKSIVRLLAGLWAYDSASSDQSSGASGTASSHGFSCLPSSEPDTLDEKLEDLDCMIFRTPHSFWLDADANERTFGRYPWMGIGDWRCTFPSPQGPVASCHKHDVANASLQKFTGANPTNISGGVEDGEELDEAWNPRNKALADSKLYADVMKYGCQNESIGSRYTFCRLGNDKQAAILHWGVSDVGDRDWPITHEDLVHGGGYREDIDADSSEYKFFNCDGLVPSTGNVTVTQTPGRGYRVNWTNSLTGCVPGIEITKVEVCITAIHKFGRALGCTRILNGTSTSALISLGSSWNSIPVEVVLAKTRLFPDSYSYGERGYINRHYVTPIRR